MGSFSLSFPLVPNLYPAGIGAPPIGPEILTFPFWSTLGVWISGEVDLPSREAFGILVEDTLIG